MARRITWEQPDSTLVTQVQVARAATLYGSYTTATTMNATSDGQTKSSSNTWVTNYLDTNGTFTDWYKVRFYDGTNLIWSEYSEPISGDTLTTLCTVEDVKRILDTTGRWSDDEVFNVIKDVDDMIYIECGTPLQASWSEIGKIDDTNQDTYYVGEENIYRVDRVFYGTTTKTEYFLDDGYKVNTKYGMIRILPVASGGPALDTQCDVEVHYVPRIYHLLSLYRTVVRLLETADLTSDGRPSKELIASKQKLDKVETLLAHKVGLQLSSDVIYHDSIYGINRRHITQDHDRNNYLGNYGWN